MADKGATLRSLGWLGLAGVGVLGGLLLGQVAIGGLSDDSASPASYAEVTGNPDALSVDAKPVEPCFGCTGGYGHGSAMQAKFARDDRMDAAYRELGAVEIDYASEPADDYRYGGRFDEEEDRPIIAMQSPVATLPSAATEVEMPMPSGPTVPAAAGPAVPSIEAEPPGSGAPE